MCEPATRINLLPILAIAAVTGAAVLVVIYASTILAAAVVVIGFSAGFSITLLIYKLWVTGGIWLAQRPAAAEQAEYASDAPSVPEIVAAPQAGAIEAPKHTINGVDIYDIVTERQAAR